MKHHYLVAFVFVLGCVATAGAQTQRQSYSASVTEKKEVTRQQALNPTPTRAVGALPRTARNPLQLLNPRAPQRYYAPPEETVTVNPYFERERYTRHEITGIILFGLRW